MVGACIPNSATLLPCTLSFCRAQRQVQVCTLKKRQRCSQHFSGVHIVSLATPRADQRTLYDGFLLHSTKVFGPRSKASRSPLLRTTIFSLLPEPSSLLLKHPVSNKQSTRESRSFLVLSSESCLRIEQGRAQTPPLAPRSVRRATTA